MSINVAVADGSPVVPRKILVADLLCGAGGSSTGAIRALLALGFTMEEIVLACINHWDIAIDTHRRNHPEARHFVQDIATARPTALVPEGYLDLLMASPTCTHHSNARGGKPTSDQQRSDPWHIITWLTELRVTRIIIENVWEFTSWGPVDPETGKPIKKRKGEYFNAWIATLRGLGYEVEWRKQNAADFGEATTRKCFILMGRNDGVPIRWPTPTHMRKPDEGLELFPTMESWVGAREIIDWGIKGRSIFGRDKDLAENTIRRIYAGAEEHGWPDAFLVILRNHMAARGLDLPVPAIAANGNHIGLAQPVLVNLKKDATGKSIEEPLPSPTAEASHIAMAEPLVLSQHNSGAARPAGDPLPTITTGGAGALGHPGCARPMLVEPFMLSQASGGVARQTSEPVPSIPTDGAHALISPYYGGGSGETCTAATNPLPTATAKARFGIVVPVTNSSGGPNPRSTDEPLPVMTTAKGGEFAMVMPVTHHDTSKRTRDVADPLPTATGANRGELALVDAQQVIEAVETTDGYDILFRMLEPHELAAAMGFIGEGEVYEFAGNKTQKIKQIGNAVSVKKMKAHVMAFMADAVPARCLGPAELADIMGFAGRERAA